MRSLGLPGGFKVIRRDFISAMAALTSPKLGPLAGTSLATSSPCSVIANPSPLRARSRSSENFAFASDAAITVVSLITLLLKKILFIDRSLTSLPHIQPFGKTQILWRGFGLHSHFFPMSHILTSWVSTT